MHNPFPTTNFRLFQIEGICRWQDKCNLKAEILLGGWVEKEKMLVLAFSPFPTMFSKGFFFRVIKSRNCVVKC